MSTFKERWESIAEEVAEILMNRYQMLINKEKSDFPTNTKYDLWAIDFSTDTNVLEDIFKNGTLAIGFIGLSETIELLTGKKYWENEEAQEIAYDIVNSMRIYCNNLCNQYQLNFSLLGTSGEMISGRFPEEDKKRFVHEILDKEYYTNSFHVDPDSEISAFDKIEKEGKFHSLCNGGCITYVELGESPLGNKEGLMELVEHAIESGVHYLGFNFPLDICEDCNEKGVFDICENCGGGNITRIRRVSGYLEDLDYFTKGKKAEVRHRKRN